MNSRNVEGLCCVFGPSLKFIIIVLYLFFVCAVFAGLPWWLRCKVSACNAGDLGSTLGQEDLLEKGMAAHFSILA